MSAKDHQDLTLVAITKEAKAELIQDVILVAGPLINVGTPTIQNVPQFWIET